MTQGKKGSAAIRIAVSIGLLAALFSMADAGSIAASFASFDWKWLVPAFATIVAAVAASAAKWGLLLRAEGIESGFGELYRAYSIGFFFNNFLPSSIGGDGARVLLLGKRNGNGPAIAASVVAERAIATVTLALVGCIAASLSAKTSALAWPAFGAAFLLGSAAIAVILCGRVPGFLRRREGRIAKALQSFAESGALLRRRPALLAASGPIAALFQILVVGVNMAILAGLGVSGIGFIDLCWIVSAASVLAMVPISVNGYGLREGAYAFLLSPFGLSAATSVSASVLFALCVSAYSLSGAWFWLRDGRRPGRDRSALSPDRALAPLEEENASTSRVSIVIPVLNDRDGLERLLWQLRAHVESSGDRDIEIVVSDGGSSDGSDELALEAGAILVRGPRGRGGQLDRGAGASSGRILLFLHADASIGGDFLPTLRRAVGRGAVWGCASFSFDDEAPALRAIAWGSRVRARLFSLCFGDQGIFCLRSLYESEGGFPDIPLMEDLELSRRLRKRSRAYVLPSVIVASARRFKMHGVLPVFLKMKAIRFFHALGVSPRLLARIY